MKNFVIGLVVGVVATSILDAILVNALFEVNLFKLFWNRIIGK